MDLSLLPTLVAVFLGGAVGGAMRYGVMAAVSQAAPKLRGAGGTHAVNLSGSLAIGLLAGLSLGGDLLWTVVAIGVLGSYTTVSTFSLDILQLAHRGRWRRAALHAAIALLGCPAMAVAGHTVTNKAFGFSGGDLGAVHASAAHASVASVASGASATSEALAEPGALAPTAAPHDGESLTR
jgi:fluoride exporter